MIKYFCDKCGKELEDYDIFTVEIVPPEIRQWSDDTHTGTCIMCRPCVKWFQDWLKGE